MTRQIETKMASLYNSGNYSDISQIKEQVQNNNRNAINQQNNQNNGINNQPVIMKKNSSMKINNNENSNSKQENNGFMQKAQLQLNQISQSNKPVSLQVPQQQEQQDRSLSKSPAKDYREKVDQENERLIESVSKVTDLLRANQFLRDEIEKLQKGSDNRDNELFTITQENVQLRERIEIMEAIIKTNKSEYETLVSAKVFSNMEKSTYEFHGGNKNKTNTIDQVYQELIDLRENNRVLEKRVKTLEKQNIDIQKNLNYVGNNEPSRPIVKTRRTKPQKNSGYNQESDQLEEDDVVNMPISRGFDDPPQMTRSLNKVQSTPMIKMTQYQNSQGQMSHQQSNIDQVNYDQDSYSQAQLRASQYSKGSNNSNNQWFQMKKPPQQKNPSIDQFRNTNYTQNSQGQEQNQQRLHNARSKVDIAAVIPPIPRDQKRSYNDISPQPTLAQLMRKRQ